MSLPVNGYNAFTQQAYQRCVVIKQLKLTVVSPQKNTFGLSFIQELLWADNLNMHTYPLDGPPIEKPGVSKSHQIIRLPGLFRCSNLFG